MLWEFFKLYPTPEAAVRADWRELAQLLNPLGLHEKRAQILIRFSGAWVLPPPAIDVGSQIVPETFLNTRRILCCPSAGKFLAHAVKMEFLVKCRKSFLHFNNLHFLFLLAHVMGI